MCLVTYNLFGQQYPFQDSSLSSVACVRKANDNNSPLKTLKGFPKVNLPSGKSVQAVVGLPYNSFEFYDREQTEMIVAAGKYEAVLWKQFQY